MDRDEINTLDVFLALSAGYCDIFPEVELICWLRSVQVLDNPTAKLFMVQTTEPLEDAHRWPRTFETIELNIAAEKAQTLGALLVELGILEQELQVRDTTSAESIWWARVIFEVAINGRSRKLEFGLGPEGVAGQDADKLRGVFRMLLEMGHMRNEWSRLLTQESESYE